MKKMKLLLSIVSYSVLTIIPQANIAQALNSEQVLAKSINYHDPEGKWEKGQFHLPLYESRPNGSYRLTDVKFDNQKQIF